MTRPRVLIATYPFSEAGSKPLDLLRETGWELIANPFGRRFKAGEVENFLEGVDGVIAGTEPYTEKTLAKAGRLKVIARVGIGLDNVDFDACVKRDIAVTYTPDAPSQGVAELTVANILNLSRHILASDRSVRAGAWNRLMGKLLSELVIGVVGVGRIGKKVCRLLQPFEPKLIACDLVPDEAFGRQMGLCWASKVDLFRQADLVTLHIPNNRRNHYYVDRQTLALMKTGSALINTSRGGVVDTLALTDALAQRHLGGAALDVFEDEPYEGPLIHMDNVVLTAHIGASACASRYLMELGAAEDCVRVLRGLPPLMPAPASED